MRLARVCQLRLELHTHACYVCGDGMSSAELDRAVSLASGGSLGSAMLTGVKRRSFMIGCALFPFAEGWCSSCQAAQPLGRSIDVEDFREGGNDVTTARIWTHQE
jgi:hypothetical protein